MKQIKSLQAPLAFSAVTVDAVASVRSAILADDKLIKILDKMDARAGKDVHLAFLSTDSLDKSICEALAGLHGTKLLDATAVSKLSYRLKSYRLQAPYAMFYIIEANVNLAKTILNVLGDLGYIQSTTVDEPYWQNGEKKFNTVTTHDFGADTEKELLKGLHDEPGKVINKMVHVKTGGSGTLKLSATQKALTKATASMRFRVVRADKAVLEEYFKQTSWYKEVLAAQSRESKLAETPFQLRKRVKGYVSLILQEMEKDAVYLSNWFDYRLRYYYDLTMLGINPHGDSFETSMWELADGRKISKSGYEDLAHSVVSIATGKRHSHQATMKLWLRNSKKYLATVVDVKHYQDADGKWDRGGFGDHFYGVRLAQAIADYSSGTPSHFMLGEDATSGGVQHAGSSFRSVKMMKGSNIGGLKTIGDIHGNMATAFDIERYKAKEVNQGLINGAGWKSTADALSAVTGVDYDSDYTKTHAIEAYGDEITNFNDISTWGAFSCYDSSNPSLKWNSKDGEKCQSIAFYESVPLTAYGLSLSATKGYTSVKVHRDMPMLLNNKGKTIYDNPKLMGLFANITHSIDAGVSRYVYNTMIGMDRVLLMKHDKFYAHPNDAKLIRKSYKSALLANFEYQPYQRALEQVAHNHTDKIPLPALIIGDGTKAMIEKSEGFLQA